MRSLILCLILVGCASPYSKDILVGGFSDGRVSENSWHIEYSGNSFTSHLTVQSYWLYRAAEVTLEQDFDGFAIPDHLDLDRGVIDSLIGNPVMSSNILLLKNPLEDLPGRIFDATKLKKFLEPHVKGKKCGTNVCSHVREYMHSDFED